jgi:glycosyltransferase involved in cell wall biosynthesis
MIPKLSVIVPIYNVEAYLPRCVNSILSQSYLDFELLLIDDGSPDNCGKICDEYAQKDSRVRVFHKPNGGVSSARNLGLDNACGEWVTFIDSDDYVDADYLKELIHAQQWSLVDYVVTLNGSGLQEGELEVCRDKYNLLFSKYHIDRNGYVIGKLYKVSIINSLHLRFNVNIHLGEDAMFALQYLLETRNVVLISSNKYCYETQRPGSLTKTLNSYESELAGKKEFDRIVNEIKEKLDLNDEAIAKLEDSQRYYIERTLASIMRLTSRKDRLQKINNLDLTLYYKYKKPCSWKEQLLFYILKQRWSYLYDCIMTIKNNMIL